MIIAKKKPMVIRDLADGLIIRRLSQEDTEALATFNAVVHSDEGPGHPDEKVAAWTRDLLSSLHPTHQPDDFAIVEETKTGRIISVMNLISQTWTYEGIPFKVGRPELVGTLPEYRRRGLVRLQFEEVHKWSAQRGELVQVITGIRSLKPIQIYTRQIEVQFLLLRGQPELQQVLRPLHRRYFPRNSR